MQFQLYRKPEITLETNFSDNEYRQKSNEVPISMLVRFHEIFFPQIWHIQSQEEALMQ